MNPSVLQEPFGSPCGPKLEEPLEPPRAQAGRSSGAFLARRQPVLPPLWIGDLPPKPVLEPPRL